MRVDSPSVEQRGLSFSYLEARARRSGAPVCKYIDLGTHMVRLVNCSPAFTPHVEKQLTWALKDDAPRYDATLFVWQEKNLAEVALALMGHYAPKRYHSLRVQKLARANPEIPDIKIFDEELLRNRPLIDVDQKGGVFSAWDPQSNTLYYAVDNLEPEEFIKRGHIFVKSFYRILKGPSSNLAHGAVVGLQGKGVLFCGIGYRGKSTLAVNAMLDGFDYVSDDYLVLGKEDGILRAWPIYSIIALSPEIYQKMYSRLRAKFVSNNARKDKYIFNIAEYHDTFCSGYPVRLCMFPQITQCETPSIVPGGKEAAIEELAFSSLRPMGDPQDVLAIGKFCSFVDNLPFYRFNLSPDIDRNTRCLRDFLERFE
jgi:hypothetical protein